MIIMQRMLGNIDGTGSGDRKELLKWVWKSMDNKWIGMGEVQNSLIHLQNILEYIHILEPKQVLKISI